MEDKAFDQALIGAAFSLIAQRGWNHVSVAGAARSAGLPLERARARFPTKIAILLRFGVLADQAALARAPSAGPVRDRLFDMIMCRLDAFQPHRAGVTKLLHALPAHPATALLLAVATRRSMRWLLEAAGVESRGLGGELRTRGLVAVWLWTVRAWMRDDSADLAATMAALDHALERAEGATRWLPSHSRDGTAGGGEEKDGPADFSETVAPASDSPPAAIPPLETPPEPPSPPGTMP